jgi:TRAP-type C4-dicarboxylate transport system permease small subunit
MENIGDKDMKNRFDEILAQVNDIATSLLFIAMLITVIGSVVLRYVFGFSYRWSDELARYLFIYIVFLGIPIAFRENIHAAIKYFTSKFFSRVKFALHVFCDILIGLTTIYIGYYTIIMIQGRLGKTLSSGLKIPMGYIYISVLICIGLLLIEIIQRFFTRYKNVPQDEDLIDEVIKK